MKSDNLTGFWVLVWLACCAMVGAVAHSIYLDHSRAQVRANEMRPKKQVERPAMRNGQPKSEPEEEVERSRFGFGPKIDVRPSMNLDNGEIEIMPSIDNWGPRLYLD